MKERRVVGRVLQVDIDPLTKEIKDREKMEPVKMGMTENERRRGEKGERVRRKGRKCVRGIRGGVEG